MTIYLLVVNEIRPLEGPIIPASDVYCFMMEHKCWEFTEQAPFFKHMQAEDVLVYYLAGHKARYFAGQAVVAGIAKKIDKDDSGTFDRQSVPYFSWRIPLKNIITYPPKAIDLDVLKKLSFVQKSTVEEKHIGLLIRVGIRKLELQDLELITKELASVTKQ